MASSLTGRVHCRKTAPFHVQIQLEKEEVAVPATNDVRGRVVRIFRGDGRLQPGDLVTFKIYVCRPGGEPTGPAFIYEKALAAANYLEAYLNGNPPNYELAAYELEIVEAPTDEPKMNVAQLEELVRGKTPVKKKWWKFT